MKISVKGSLLIGMIIASLNVVMFFFLLEMQLSSITDIPEFKESYVHIRNEQELLQKINKIIGDGPNKLQIVTDFDHTLTRHSMDNGKTVLTSFG